MQDCAVIGGGPAGLAAALVLARSRKRVALLDGGSPRNITAASIGGFITHDRVSPARFRAAAHDDLRAYPSVDLHLETLVDRITRRGSEFRVHAGGAEHDARTVLLATGILDDPFPLPGARELWGVSLLQCPYCHGWEWRDQRFGFVAPDADCLEFALLLRSWTSNVMVFTNGAFELPREQRGRLIESSIPVEERRIIGVDRDGSRLRAVIVDGGAAIPRDVLFFRPPQRQTPIVAQLAPALSTDGYVDVGEDHQTSLPGVYAAGDLVTHYHGALAAAASGSMAAHSINRALTLDLVGKGLM